MFGERSEEVGGLAGGGPQTYHVNSKLGGGEGSTEGRFLRLSFCDF